jgi:hypothetical protein
MTVGSSYVDGKGVQPTHGSEARKIPSTRSVIALISERLFRQSNERQKKGALRREYFLTRE